MIFKTRTFSTSNPEIKTQVLNINSRGGKYLSWQRGSKQRGLNNGLKAVRNFDRNRLPQPGIRKYASPVNSYDFNESNI